MNIDKDIEEKIILLKDFIEGNFERDKIEHYKGSYKMGFFYYSDIKDAISNVLKELEKKDTDLNKYREFHERRIREWTKKFKKQEEDFLSELDERDKELETQINNTHILQSQLDVANAEKIEWKKIAEKLAKELIKNANNQYCQYSKEYCLNNMLLCKNCVLGWARKEVENDSNNN